MINRTGRMNCNPFFFENRKDNFEMAEEFKRWERKVIIVIISNNCGRKGISLSEGALSSARNEQINWYYILGRSMGTSITNISESSVACKVKDSVSQIPKPSLVCKS